MSRNGQAVDDPAEIPAASIVIPTLNEEKYLPVLLDSLKRVSAPMEVIVVDGASTDGTVNVVERYAPALTSTASLRLLRSDERNIALQRNMGAAASSHDLLIFCDADVRVPSHETYATLVARFTQGRMAVAAPILAPIERRPDVKLAYKVVYWWQRLVLLQGRPYFAGSFLMTTKDVFSRLGGFDTTIELAEDVDYSLRAARLGPYQLMNVAMGISARRLIKYGYWWVFKSLPTIARYTRTGVIPPGTIDYPFGDYEMPTRRRSNRRSG